MLQSVALREDTPNPLKSLAWYWIGYEHNNLAEFEDARISFERALETTEGARRYELSRILLESRFFNKNKESTEVLIPYFETLLKSIESEKVDEEFEENKRKILITIGNVYYQFGNELKKNGKNEEVQKNTLKKLAKISGHCLVLLKHYIDKEKKKQLILFLKR